MVILMVEWMTAFGTDTATKKGSHIKRVAELRSENQHLEHSADGVITYSLPPSPLCTHLCRVHLKKKD